MSLSSSSQFANSNSIFKYSLKQLGVSKGNVIQSVDMVGNEIYSLHTSGTTNHKSVITKYEFDSAGNPKGTRYYIDESNQNNIGHQGLSHEKTITKLIDGKTTEVHIFWSSYTSTKGNDDPDKIVRFELYEDPRNSAKLIVSNSKVFEVWENSSVTGSASPTVSSDGKYLIVEDSNYDGGCIRIFDIKKLAATDGTLDSSLDTKVRQFNIGTSFDDNIGGKKNPMQALASDGRYIYAITGGWVKKGEPATLDVPRKIAKMTMEGKILEVRDFEIGLDMVKSNHLEPEGLFFTSDGELAVSVATGEMGERENNVFLIGKTIGDSRNNVIHGDARSNTLFGNNGNDSLFGGYANDSLYGGNGNDKLYGGDGDDYLRDEAGHDVFDGGSGSDTASYYGRKLVNGAGVVANLGTGKNNSSDKYISIENLMGSNYTNDHLTGSSGNNKLWGQNGNDSLYGESGNDILYGGDGDDYLRDEAGHDVFDGGSGSDTASYYGRKLVNGAGVVANLGTGKNNSSDKYISIENLMGSNYTNDHLTGSSGNNKLWGQNGNDSLYGESGNDIIYGGDGDDYLRDEAGLDIFDGGAGIDTASYYGRKMYKGEGVIANLGTGKNNSGDKYISIENLMGSNYTGDHLTGSSGNNKLWGKGGKDSLYGGHGDDKLYGGDGDDYLRDETGKDVFDGGSGSDTASYYGLKSADGKGVVANLSNGKNNNGDIYISIENLRGSNYGDDILTGSSGNNKLRGEGGNDSLYGGSGNDRLYGGNGDDYLRDGSGYDLFDGGAGNDTASYYGRNLFRGQGVLANLGNGQNNCKDKYVSIENLEGSNNTPDHLTGSYGNNKLWGWGGSDSLFGGSGEDTLDGGAGNDLLYGGNGVDRLYGGNGNDTLDPSQSNSTDWQLLRGGTGSDTYVIGRGYGKISVREESEGGSGRDDTLIFKDSALSDWNLKYGEKSNGDQRLEFILKTADSQQVHLYDYSKIEHFEFRNDIQIDGYTNLVETWGSYNDNSGQAAVLMDSLLFG